jgi:muramoyltetrapeptide carboxypeptidase
MPIKPPRLNPDDYVGIVAPASPPLRAESFDHSRTFLQGLGYRTKLGAHVHKRAGFLAGTDQERAADLMQMFQDTAVRAIFCIRGGYGTARLLPLLDYAIIRANPKILVGFSDVTSLHCALLKKANLISFHGPMLSSNLLDPKLPAYTLQTLLRNLTRSEPPGGICDKRAGKSVSIMRRGKISGELLGGNLAVLTTILGTPYQPSFRGKILFFEELNEAPYRVDRFLTHLLNCGVLREVAGIAVGATNNCEEPRSKKKEEVRQTIGDVLKDRLLPLKVPVVLGLPFGHICHNATLPQGVRATLDGVNGDLLIDEPAVR